MSSPELDEMWSESSAFSDLLAPNEPKQRAFKFFHPVEESVPILKYVY